MQSSIEQQKPTNKSQTHTNCHPFTYTNGYEPSAGLLLVGAGKSNWYPVVASIRDEQRALTAASKLQEKDPTYPLEVHKATDSKGKAV